MRHPSREQLLAYVESLIDQATPVSSTVAAHVAGCKRCAAEVRDMRESLDFTASAQALEPSKDLTAQILLAAQDNHSREPRWRVPEPLRRAGRLAAVVVLGLGVATWFRFVLAPSPNDIASSLAVRDGSGPVPVSQPVLSTRDRMDEITRLAAATAADPRTPKRPAERALRRIAIMVSENIKAARDALRRNPRSPRARAALEHALAVEEDALRALYLIQSPPSGGGGPPADKQSRDPGGDSAS